MIPFGFQIAYRSSGCEDAPPQFNRFYSIVCDGLGGSGSFLHSGIDSDDHMNNHTSAYIGSRIVCDVVDSFLEKNYEIFRAAVFNEENDNNLEINVLSMTQELKKELDNHLTDFGISDEIRGIIENNNLRLFPTTLASAVFFENDGEITVLAIWAGDSRVYLLDPQKGLLQLSRDDTNLSDESAEHASTMNNCVSADNDFFLNFAVYRVDIPQIIFCCSDGCFDRLPSPLIFEWKLLQSFIRCSDAIVDQDLGQTIRNSIKMTLYEKPSDDITMCGVLVGMGQISDLKKAFLSRYEFLNPIARNLNEINYRFERAKKIWLNLKLNRNHWGWRWKAN